MLVVLLFRFPFPSPLSVSYEVVYSTPTLFSQRNRNSLGMEQSCTALELVRKTGNGALGSHWYRQRPLPGAVRQLDEAKFLQLRSWRRRLTSK